MNAFNINQQHTDKNELLLNCYPLHLHDVSVCVGDFFLLVEFSLQERYSVTYHKCLHTQLSGTKWNADTQMKILPLSIFCLYRENLVPISQLLSNLAFALERHSTIPFR